MPLDIANMLRQYAASSLPFTPQDLSSHFGIPAKHFLQTEQNGPILFVQADSLADISYLLRGTIFWPDNSQIVRGHPRILPTSDHTLERLAVEYEPIFAQAAFDGTECIVEPKVIGVTVRVYSHATDLYCATDVSHDGGNPLIGAGIDNARALGIDFGSEAARIMTSRYPKIERLTRLGFTAVFVLQLPEFASDGSIDRSDVIFVDAFDPDLNFVDRLEKERIAEDYGLNLVPLEGRMTLPANDTMAFVRRCRALDHQAQQSGAAGFVVKARLDERSDQLILKIESSAERDRIRGITSSDLTAATAEISQLFGGQVWSDEQFAEAMLLDFLGSRHRSVRWRVQEYLNNWREARKITRLAEPTAAKEID